MAQRITPEQALKENIATPGKTIALKEQFLQRGGIRSRARSTRPESDQYFQSLVVGQTVVDVLFDEDFIQLADHAAGMYSGRFFEQSEQFSVFSAKFFELWATHAVAGLLHIGKHERIGLPENTNVQGPAQTAEFFSNIYDRKIITGPNGEIGLEGRAPLPDGILLNSESNKVIGNIEVTRKRSLSYFQRKIKNTQQFLSAIGEVDSLLPQGQELFGYKDTDGKKTYHLFFVIPEEYDPKDPEKKIYPGIASLVANLENQDPALSGGYRIKGHVLVIPHRDVERVNDTAQHWIVKAFIRRIRRIADSYSS